jgi:hypothetical protein
VADYTPDPKEYDGLQWFLTDDVLAGEFHPALKAAIRDLRATQAHVALDAAVHGGGTVDDIAALAKTFVAAAHRPAEGPVQVTFHEGKYVCT